MVVGGGDVSGGVDVVVIAVVGRSCSLSIVRF